MREAGIGRFTQSSVLSRPLPFLGMLDIELGAIAAPLGRTNEHKTHRPSEHSEV